MIHNVYCFDCESKYEQRTHHAPDQCGACGSARVGVFSEKPEREPGSDNLGNLKAESGCDRCTCGCKYWEFDHCIDCGKHIDELLAYETYLEQNKP